MRMTRTGQPSRQLLALRPGGRQGQAVGRGGRAALLRQRPLEIRHERLHEAVPVIALHGDVVQVDEPAAENGEREQKGGASPRLRVIAVLEPGCALVSEQETP